MSDSKKKQTPLVSVIIPTLNEKQYVGLLLGDLGNQTFTDFEVIVSDSSSEDDTIKQVKKFSDRLTLKTTVVKRVNAGYGRNGGAKKASGTFLLFLDADGRIPDDYLQKIINKQSKTNADFATTKYSADSKNVVDKFLFWFASTFLRFRFFIGKPAMAGCTQLIKADYFNKIGGYNSTMKTAEDIDISNRLVARGAKGVFVYNTQLKTSSRRFKVEGRARALINNLRWNLYSATKWGWLIKNHEMQFGSFKPTKKSFTRRFLRVVIIGLFCITGIIFLIGNAYSADEEKQFGVSFSTKYAQELGLDWQQTLQRSASELPIPHYRLMTYWNQTEPLIDLFDFSSIDTQLQILAEHNKTATLVVGLRQPRWPECHQPNWYNSLSKSAQQTQELQFIEAIAREYRFNPVVVSWQLENESANRNFGDCPEFDKQFHEQKYTLLQSLSTKPIIINTSNQSGWPIQNPVGDRTGFSVYKEAHFDSLGKTWSWKFWYVPSWWHGFRAKMVEWQHGTTAFIHELQTEPWAPGATAELQKTELDQYFSPQELERNITFATQTGMKEIWLWGVEFWYWYEQEFEDSSYIEQVVESVQQF